MKSSNSVSFCKISRRTPRGRVLDPPQTFLTPKNGFNWDSIVHKECLYLTMKVAVDILYIPLHYSPCMSPVGDNSYSRNRCYRTLSLFSFYPTILLLLLLLLSIWFVRCVITRHDKFDPGYRVGSSSVCHPRLSL